MLVAKTKRQTRSQSSGRRSQPPADSDHVDRAIAYARDAVADTKGVWTCKWLRLAAARYLRDLRAAEKPGHAWRFDRAAANDACEFIELLPHVEGQWETPNIVLHASHAFLVVQLFGFRKPDGSRRFTSALLAVARKNAKSTIAAAILLYCLVLDGELGPQVISAATTGDQARIVFGVAKRMVEKTPALREHFALEPFAHAIASYGNGGTFKPINAKASTQDGLNPSAVGLDEVHAHKSADLLNVLNSAAGARRSPLFLFTTTEGYETPGPWPELRRFAQQILERAVEADHFLALLYSIDEDDDPFDPAVWIKANPLMDVNPILHAEIAKLAIEARAMPSKRSEFLIKRCNRQAATATGWVNLEKWRKCDGLVDLEALETLPCWVGVDLASTTDITALRIVWRDGDRWLTYGRRWVPADAVVQRRERGTVRYDGWVSAGHILQTEGETVDYAVIERDIRDVCARFNVQRIAFDPWNARDLMTRLAADEAIGKKLVEFRQGARSYHAPMQELERAYVGGRLATGDDPVLLWSASNLVARRDENDNMAPSRQRSADKIDDMAALLMAMGAALAETGPATKSMWDQ